MQTHGYQQNIKTAEIFSNIEPKLVDILLTTNSSTTRLLEAMTGQTMEINVINQEIVSKDKLFEEYTESLEISNTYLKRIVSLHSKGRVFSDNIVLASYDNISEEVKAGLIKSKIPLGKLIKDKETKRKLLWKGNLSKRSLNLSFGNERFLLSNYPAKKYLIYMNEHCCFSLLEVFHVNEIAKYFVNKL